jgi:hypothetical protein
MISAVSRVEGFRKYLRKLYVFFTLNSYHYIQQASYKELGYSKMMTSPTALNCFHLKLGLA